MIVLIAWLKVRNLPKIDKGKKKNKEKETGKALESRLQVIEKFYDDDRSGESEREDEGKIESEMRAVVDTKEALSGRK